MRLTLAALLTVLASLPASAHGLHAASVDGHAHGPLVAALVVLPALAVVIVALVRGGRG